MIPQRTGGDRPKPRESGQVLIVALVVVLLVGVATSLVAASMALRTRHAIEEGTRLRLTALTDAGVAEALAHLSRDPGFAGEPGGELGGGTYESRVQGLGGGLLEIWVEARVGGRLKRVRVTARLLPDGPQVLRWQRLPVADS